MVVSPLIALMIDQVENLKKKGIDAICLHSGMHRNEIDRELDNAIYGKYDFLYISPERLQTEFFQARKERLNPGLIAIDEAHCISQWGHDFRPSYLLLENLKDWFPNTPIAAFTATANENTLSDIQKYLRLKEAKVFRKSFVKENLSYSVLKSTEKKVELQFILKRLKGSGIIYARNRRKCEEIASFLAKNNFNVDYYHAGLDYQLRSDKQEKWTSGETQIIVSTNAFGMGIDKSDVRWVIHFDIPPSIEEYYQEAGRAGRDGNKCYAILLYDDKDLEDGISNLNLSYVDHKILNDIYEKLYLTYNIPIGGGEDESFDFDLNDFARKHKIPVLQVLSTLKSLVDNNLIYISDSFFSPSTLYFHISRETLIREHSNKSFYSFLLVLLRNYEGLFNYPVKISEEKIMRLTNSNYKTVIDKLHKINELELGKYEARKTTPQLRFLQARYEAKSLPVDYAKLKMLNKNRKDKLDAMYQFILGKQCREQFILAYFNEKSKIKCRRCDFCLSANYQDFTRKDLLEFDEYLKGKLKDPVNFTELLHWWPLNKRKMVLAMIKLLENEGKVKLENRKISYL